MNWKNFPTGGGKKTCKILSHHADPLTNQPTTNKEINKKDIQKIYAIYATMYELEHKPLHLAIWVYA